MKTFIVDITFITGFNFRVINIINFVVTNNFFIKIIIIKAAITAITSIDQDNFNFNFTFKIIYFINFINSVNYNLNYNFANSNSNC